MTDIFHVDRLETIVFLFVFLFFSIEIVGPVYHTLNNSWQRYHRTEKIMTRSSLWRNVCAKTELTVDSAANRLRGRCVLGPGHVSINILRAGPIPPCPCKWSTVSVAWPFQISLWYGVSEFGTKPWHVAWD